MDVLIRKPCEHTGETPSGESPLYPWRQRSGQCSYKPRNTKACRKLPQAGRGKDGISPGAFRGSETLQTP